MKRYEIKAAAVMRLDKYLMQHYHYQHRLISRTLIQRWIKDQHITVNDCVVKPNYCLKIGDHIVIYEQEQQLQHHIIPNPTVKFQVVYEDEALLVIDKPNDLVVHPAPGHIDDTILNKLVAQATPLSDVAGVFRWGIVHRIDRQTTGLLVVAKTNESHMFLAEQLKTKTMIRKYKCIVHGIISENHGKIIAPIGRNQIHRHKMSVVDKGRDAVTHFQVLERFAKATFLACQLETGRTHQIRVHLAYIKHPVYGDPLYSFTSDKSDSYGQYLHAYELQFIHPLTKVKMIFESGLPDAFQLKLKSLQQEGQTF